MYVKKVWEGLNTASSHTLLLDNFLFYKKCSEKMCFTTLFTAKTAAGCLDFEVYEKIFLITAYPKSEKDNLTQAERNELKQLVEILERQLEEK